MLAAGFERDDQLQLGAGPPADERLRRRTRGTSRPACSGLPSRHAADWPLPAVNLLGSCTAQSLVGPVDVVVAEQQLDLSPEPRQLVGHQDEPPRALTLHGPDHALDDRDAAALADGPEP